MALIREDKHSPYIVFNGGIYRPVKSAWRFHPDHGVSEEKGPVWIGDGWKYVTGTTRFKAGDKPKVKNVNYTPYANVEGELWTTHGTAWTACAPGGDGVRMVDSETRWANGRLYDPEGEDL